MQEKLLVLIINDMVIFPNNEVRVEYDNTFDKQMISIIEKLDRTTTIIQAEGGYSRKSKKVVMVSFTMSQYATLTNLINIIDRQAFVSIHRAHEINGEGWSRPSPDPEKVNNENN